MVEVLTYPSGSNSQIHHNIIMTAFFALILYNCSSQRYGISTLIYRTYCKYSSGGRCIQSIVVVSQHHSKVGASLLEVVIDIATLLSSIIRTAQASTTIALSIVDVNQLSPYLTSVSTDDTYILSRIDTRDDVHVNDMKFSGCVYCRTMNQHTLVHIQLTLNTTPSITNNTKRSVQLGLFSYVTADNSTQLIHHCLLFECSFNASFDTNGRHVK